jgi:hypothetical protein
MNTAWAIKTWKSTAQSADQAHRDMWKDLDIRPVNMAATPPCTWQDFKQKVVTCKRITTELFSNLYDETYQLGSVTGKISTTRDGKRHVYWTVEWAPSIILEAHKAKAEADWPGATTRPHPDPTPTELTRIRHLLPEDETPRPPLVRVEWPKTVMEEADIEKNYPETFPALRDTYLAQKPEVREVYLGEPSAPSDSHLAQHVRQGLPQSGAALLPLSDWRQIRESITIDPVERNPDRDITPPRAYCIQLGTHRTVDPEPLNATTAFIYAPSGRCMGTLSADTLAGLQAQYTNPADGSFERATAHLLQRYPPERNNSSQIIGRTSITPPALMAALSEACGGPQNLSERFASPLDRSPHAHTYWSKHSEDSAFGEIGRAHV